MRDNPIRAKALRGEHSYGSFFFEFVSPGLMQILANAGCEWVLIDMEHSGFDISVIKEQAAYARGLGIEPFVRVPTAQYHFISRVLDCGATGVMIPMVESESQLEIIAEAVRYPPSGRRGAIFGGAHDDYAAGSVLDKMRTANARNLIIAQIETERGLALVDRIVGHPVIDCGWIGHFDLSNFIGVPGRFDSKKFLDARTQVAAACRKHGKAAGALAVDQAWAEDWRAAGFNMIAYGADVNIIHRFLSEGIAALRKSEPKPRKVGRSRR